MSKWIKELRITHYLKNCLIFLPTFFGGFINMQNTWRNLVAGFLCFCLGASAVYLMNDVKDVEKDRLHPQKCTRPIAAGEITISQAIVVAIALLVACVAVIWFGVQQPMRMPAMLVFGIYIVDN